MWKEKKNLEILQMMFGGLFQISSGLTGQHF